jgi:hypothetical protein
MYINSKFNATATLPHLYAGHIHFGAQKLEIYHLIFGQRTAKHYEYYQSLNSKNILTLLQSLYA